LASQHVFSATEVLLDRRLQAPAASRRGLTLIELVSVVAIIGTLSALAVPKLHEAVDRARVARAIGDIRSIQISLETRDSLPDDLSSLGPLPLDPWSRPYVYNKFEDKHVPQGARRDRFLVPLNSTYDLYSQGADGESSPALNVKASRDDIVRANDGGFIGLASRY
jgi:general secretion pathway protein G